MTSSTMLWYFTFSIIYRKEIHNYNTSITICYTYKEGLFAVQVPVQFDCAQLQSVLTDLCTMYSFHCPQSEVISKHALSFYYSEIDRLTDQHTHTVALIVYIGCTHCNAFLLKQFSFQSFISLPHVDLFILSAIYNSRLAAIMV